MNQLKSGGKNIPGDIHIPYDPATPFLRIYPMETRAYVHQSHGRGCSH